MYTYIHRCTRPARSTLWRTREWLGHVVDCADQSREDDAFKRPPRLTHTPCIQLTREAFDTSCLQQRYTRTHVHPLRPCFIGLCVGAPRARPLPVSSGTMCTLLPQVVLCPNKKNRRSRSHPRVILSRFFL